jgi:hypothetical protein
MSTTIDKQPLDIGFGESLSKMNQMLSNFKLFSKNRSVLPIQTEPLNPDYSKYVFVIIMFLFTALIFVYLQREVFSQYLQEIGVSSLVEKWWLNTHLTSAGELASTYVPGDFSEYVSSLVDSSSVVSSE